MDGSLRQQSLHRSRFKSETKTRLLKNEDREVRKGTHMKMKMQDEKKNGNENAAIRFFMGKAQKKNIYL